MNFLEILEIIGGFVGILAIIIVAWDHFKDDRLLTKRVQEFYEDIENLIYTFIQKKTGKGSPSENPTQRNLYYKGKVEQNFENYSNYLGLTINEEYKGQYFYYNESDYMLNINGEIWYRRYGSDRIRLIKDYHEIKNVNSINYYLQTLRDYWIDFYHNRLFRKKIRTKLDFFNLLFT